MALGSEEDCVEIEVKVLLDSDVFIHFCRLNETGLLYRVFGDRLEITKAVRQELSTRPQYTNEIDSFINDNNIEVIDISNEMDYMFEYCPLIAVYGVGESSCMATAKVQKKHIASSNLSDIRTFCSENKITNYPFLEIILLAISKGLINEGRADTLISGAIQNGAKLPAPNVVAYRIYKNANP